MAHHRLRLTREDDDVTSMRPDLSVWYDPSDADTDCVTLGISAAWGAAQRFICLSPEEAKALAGFLIKTAREAEAHKLAEMADPS